MQGRFLFYVSAAVFSSPPAPPSPFPRAGLVCVSARGVKLWARSLFARLFIFKTIVGGRGKQNPFAPVLGRSWRKIRRRSPSKTARIAYHSLWSRFRLQSGFDSFPHKTHFVGLLRGPLFSFVVRVRASLRVCAPRSPLAVSARA